MYFVQLSVLNYYEYLAYWVIPSSDTTAGVSWNIALYALLMRVPFFSFLPWFIQLQFVPVPLKHKVTCVITSASGFSCDWMNFTLTYDIT